MQVGDKVRFLNEVGEGVISGFQGKDIVLVEDTDGFEIPVRRNEVVVIDEEKERRSIPQPDKEKEEEERETEPADRPVTFRPRPVERAGGNVLNVFLAWLPSERRENVWNLFLINDSNYQLTVQILAQQGSGWTLRHSGQLQPNMKQKVCEVGIEQVGEWEHLCVQLLACKTERPFGLKPAFSVPVHVPSVKFYKGSSFRHSPFFGEDAWVMDVVRNDAGDELSEAED